MDFDAETISSEEIRAEDEYVGIRIRLIARIGTARLHLQIDIGLGDSVWPAPQADRFPALLDFEAAEILVYPPEAVVAEKLEAMIVLGDRNSRIKDFFDLHYLAEHFEFDRSTLVETIRRTFQRRGTPFRTEPIGLTPGYWDNPSRPAQIRSFTRRSGIDVPKNPDVEIGRPLREFLLPLLQDLADGRQCDGTWPPGGPWHE